jgi:hypothetical protein
VRFAAVVVFACSLLLVGCGGGGGLPTSTQPEPPAGSLEALWKAPGEDVAVVPGASDFAPGTNRYTFLVVDGRGKPAERPTARVWLARGLKQAPFEQTTARLENVGVPGGYTADVTQLYVATLDLPKPGRYWLLAEPVGGRKIQAIGTVDVKAKPAAPAVGDRAFASQTPTLATAGGNLKLLTTRAPPDTELLRDSVAGSLAAHVPFVVAFATPKFCTSRTCGPVVDVVDAVRRRLTGTGVRFIHVEIYERNDPANGFNRWVREWKLPTEPWVFLVGSDGRIKARFEGAVSVRELEAAVRATLLRKS